MKKILCITACLLLIASFAACDKKSNGGEVVGRGHVFEAVVKAVNEESILVMPAVGTDEVSAATDIGLVVVKSDSIPQVKVGDKVRIDYDGTMTRSIPAQLGEVYSLEVID